jgi:RND family efflux transporter MFP subunit
MQRVATLAFRQYESVCRANRSTAEIIRSFIAPGSWPTAAKWSALVFSIAMLIPLPYRVSCDCRVQPTERRFVAAPYHGILEKSLVEAGEIVTEGQVVARMDGRQLRIELAGLEAEYKGARRKSDSSRAIGEVAQSQIAKMEMRRLAAKIELTKTRMQDLEVRSPIDGIIVSGDLEKAQGAPLETGQTLFEVAPLEKMMAEIGVPESEIQYVNQDDTVKLKLNAFPFQSWTGKVERIYPGTEVIDDQTVFVTEVELDNESGRLKPGMEGAAKISTHWTPLGWNLFHNTWENIRCWTVW